MADKQTDTTKQTDTDTKKDTNTDVKDTKNTSKQTDTQNIDVSAIEQKIKELEEKQKQIFEREKLMELKSAGLESYADFFNVDSIDDLKVKIEKFQKVLKEEKVKNTYVPNDHRTTDAYTNAQKNGDVLGMIKALISK